MIQGKAKKTRKFATVKRMMNPSDIRLYARVSPPFADSNVYLFQSRKENQLKQKKKEEEEKAKAVRRVYAFISQSIHFRPAC